MFLQRTWLRREYSKVMGTNMKKLIEIHAEQATKNPKLDLARIRKVKTLHEFDGEVQCPIWGYPTVGAYYRDASSVDSLLAARIPLFAINAVDDPVSIPLLFL
jgi:predicted alpha/beta-fold hydrolase